MDSDERAAFREVVSQLAEQVRFYRDIRVEDIGGSLPASCGADAPPATGQSAQVEASSAELSKSRSASDESACSSTTDSETTTSRSETSLRTPASLVEEETIVEDPVTDSSDSFSSGADSSSLEKSSADALASFEMEESAAVSMSSEDLTPEVQTSEPRQTLDVEPGQRTLYGDVLSNSQGESTQSVLFEELAVVKTATVRSVVSRDRLEVMDESLEALREYIGECRRCRLHDRRTKLVFGEGSPRARLMFVGEGPGAEEYVTGRPFVGRAGQLLDKIIEAIGMRREEVYIANIVKCRPPGNRTPERDEVGTCEPFLFRQIA